MKKVAKNEQVKIEEQNCSGKWEKMEQRQNGKQQRLKLGNYSEDKREEITLFRITAM